MTLPCVIDFKVDGVIADPQPIDLRLITPPPTLFRTPGGYPISVKRPGGRRAVIQWGDVLLPITGALAIRLMFPDDDPNHLLTWYEPTGELITLKCSVESVTVRWTQAAQGFVEPLILTAKERA